MFVVRGAGIICITLGAFALAALFFAPETTSAASTILGVALVLGGLALFFLTQRRPRHE